MKEIVVNNMEKNTWNHLKVNNTKIVAPYIEKEDIEKYIKLKEKNIIIRNDYEEELVKEKKYNRRKEKKYEKYQKHIDEIEEDYNNYAKEIIEEFKILDKNFLKNNGYVVHEINELTKEQLNIISMKELKEEEERKLQEEQKAKENKGYEIIGDTVITDNAILNALRKLEEREKNILNSKEGNNLISDRELLEELKAGKERKEDNKIIYEKENILFESKNDETHMIEIDNNNIAIKELNIILEENSSSNIMILVNENDKKTYRDIKIKISGKDNSNANIIIMYGIGRNTFSLDSVYVEGKNSNIHMTYVFLGSDNQYMKHTTNCMENAKITVDGMYILDDRNILDMMYMAKHEEKNGNTNLLLEGAMLDNSSKLFKGIIDFKKGSTGSVADEKETVMLLSDEAKQKSLPILLSSESDITGNHAATVGKIDEKKLYYLKSRGIDEEEAAGLLILANFEKILLNIPSDYLRKMIKNILVGSIIAKKN